MECRCEMTELDPEVEYRRVQSEISGLYLLRKDIRRQERELSEKDRQARKKLTAAQRRRTELFNILQQREGEGETNG